MFSRVENISSIFLCCCLSGSSRILNLLPALFLAECQLFNALNNLSNIKSSNFFSFKRRRTVFLGRSQIWCISLSDKLDNNKEISLSMHHLHFGQEVSSTSCSSYVTRVLHFPCNPQPTACVPAAYTLLKRVQRIFEWSLLRKATWESANPF